MGARAAAEQGGAWTQRWERGGGRRARAHDGGRAGARGISKRGVVASERGARRQCWECGGGEPGGGAGAHGEQELAVFF